MSPITSAFYDMPGRMEKKLEECKLGFDVSYTERGKKVNHVIPGMFYADDIVLFADGRDELQELIKICGEEGGCLGLKFSIDKSGIITMRRGTH